MAKIIAGFGRVLVEELEPKSKTEGGLYIPETAQNKPTMGKVISVGKALVNDAEDNPLSVEVGSTIIYGKYSGIEIEYQDKKLIVVDVKDILAIESND